MLCVYGHYKYFNYFSAGTDFRRQKLTYKDGPRAERVNNVDESALGPITVSNKKS